MKRKTTSGRCSRRQFIGRALGVTAAGIASHAVAADHTPSPAIATIQHQGKLIHECSLPGERRSDWVAPAHGNGAQLSRQRFMLLVSTLGFRGLDDNRSILYQIRDGGYDGPLVKEGMLAKSIDDWDPLGDGGRYVRQFGHPVMFGVPRGAVLDGHAPPHANLFVGKWRVMARTLVREGGYLLWSHEPESLKRRTQGIEWLQFRLNDAEDDIEIVQPARPLRQKGFETGPAFCERAAGWMNQSFVQPVRLNPDGTEWADVNHFDGGRIAPLRYRFNPATRLYEWIQTGELIGGGLVEASLAPWRGEWIIAARREKGVGAAWARTRDLFGPAPRMVYPSDVATHRAPLSAYACADGVLRLFTDDPTVSKDPRHHHRDPLYCWDIAPDRDFAASNCRTILDTFGAGIPITPDHYPIVDMAKVLPHAGGRTQLLMHRVRSAGMRVTEADLGMTPRQLSADDFDATAIYWAKINYTEELPPTWNFA